jgi:hypothetical protein
MMSFSKSFLTSLLPKGGKVPLYQEGGRGVFIPPLEKRGKGRFS